MNLKTMNIQITAMKKDGKKALFILLATLILITIVEAVTSITMTGSWSLSIGQADLTGGAGSELTSPYTSATDEATLGVSGTLGNSWIISVMRIDTTWYEDFRLRVKRTNNGTSGSGSYSGGTTFLTLTTTDQTFMTGAGNRTGFTLQFRLAGVSTAIPAESYSTTIRYTIVQTS
jgi:hypothetical protein